MIKWIKKKNYQIRLLQLLFVIITALGLIFAPLSWMGLGLAAYCFLETIGGNIGLHRYFGHRSFKTTESKESLLRFFSHYIGVGSVMSWVGQHRYHHKHSDNPTDVHSPVHQGIFQIMFGVWKIRIERSMIQDVLTDDKLKWWHSVYWYFHGSIVLTLFSIDFFCNTWFLFSVYAFPNLLCLISGYVLAIVTHSHGYQTYPVDRSTNSWIANIYTLGEGWHNNHHAFPGRLQQGEQWWEWDLPAFIIRKMFLKHGG